MSKIIVLFALRYVYTYEGEDNNLLGNVFIYKEVKVMRMIEVDAAKFSIKEEDLRKRPFLS